MRSLLAIATAALLSTSALAQTAPSSAQMDGMMKSMQEMHDKMMTAKTPEERQALMNEHMKMMQGGMSMMGQMRGAKGAMDPRSMNRRMDMMEMMMQMMLDREAAQSSTVK